MGNACEGRCQGDERSGKEYLDIADSDNESRTEVSLGDVGTNNLEEAEVDVLRDIFRELDVNADGQVTKKELTSRALKNESIRDILLLPPGTAKQRKTILSVKFNRMDTDDNSLVSWPEFVRFIDSEKGQAQQEQQNLTPF